VTPEAAAMVRKIRARPEKVGHQIGFTDMVKLHGDWIRTMVWEDKDFTLQAHRGSYKSSCLAVAISLILVLFPSRNIIFLRKTDSDVAEMMGMVAKILRSNFMIKLVKVVYGQDLKVEGESMNHLSTNHLQGLRCRMTLNDYLSLFPGASRDREKLMALAEAVLRQAMDLQAVIPDIQAAFKPDNASGEQLDMIGESLGLSRLDTSAGAAATDEEYRDYIKKKLILWSWDGTNKSVPVISERLRQGSFVKDNLNGTVTVTGAGTLPAALKKLFPVPAGIRTD